MYAVNQSSDGYGQNNLPPIEDNGKNNKIFILLDQSAQAAQSQPLKAQSSLFSTKIKILIGSIVSILLALASIAVVLAYFLTRNNCKRIVFLLFLVPIPILKNF